MLDSGWSIGTLERHQDHHSDKRALKLCYAVIKFAVKQFSQVKKKSYPALKSYHLKTIILWIAERSEKLPFDMYTIHNNKTLGGLLLHIITTYRQHIHDGYLQHYFISHINVLDPYGVDERTEAMHLLDEFKMKPLSIVSNFDNANLSRWKVDQFCLQQWRACGSAFISQILVKFLQEQVLCDKYLGYVLYLL